MISDIPLGATSNVVAAPAAASGRVEIFLCHNSHDKPVVLQVAEGLELEFGLPHFLDAYAIPTGEAFLPWIDRALTTSSGCAIFLGGNGWGGTHFWEAERALDRYRVDAKFRVIPVALPGIRDEDMKRLGSGTLFQQVNWADFRNGPVDPDAIRKLRAAMLGLPLQLDRGPARLTPYIVRRDAGRWVESRRKNRSILYRGRQLDEAHALRAAQPDLVNGDAIIAFLTESAAAQTQRLRWVAVISIAAAAAIGVLAVQSERAGRLALARFIAAEARQAPSPDTGLLLAVQATAISDTPEAHGALLERLDAQPYLRHMLRVSSEAVLSLAFDPAGALLYVGCADGTISRMDLRDMSRQLVGPGIAANVLAMDVDGGTGELWVGTQGGQIHVLRADGALQQARAGGPNRLPIIALQVDPQGERVAVGDHDHRLTVFDRASRTVLWTRSLKAQRVTGVSFSADGKRLAAASSEGGVDVFNAITGTPIRSMSTARTGNPRAVQFARNGDVRAVDDGNTFWVYADGQSSGKAQRMQGSGLSVAAIGPRLERGPVQRLDLVVRGFGSGDVAFTPLQGDSEEPTFVRAHARTVQAVALAHDGRLAASGAGDGTVALWDLQQRSLLFAPASTPGGEFMALTYGAEKRPVAVTTADDAALLAAWTPTGWSVLVDLMALTSMVAGPKAVASAASAPNAEGFEPLPEKVVTTAAFSNDALHLAWATRAGALLWAASPLPGAPRILRNHGPAIDALALSESGRYLYAVEGGTSLLLFDMSAPLSPGRRHALPATLRTMLVGRAGTTVLAALDDDTLRRIDFSAANPRETSNVKLAGTAGRMARDPDSDLLVVAGAGSSVGIDVGVIDGSVYRRLHSRRLGGAVSTIAMARTAGLIVVGDLDGRLHMWDIDTLVPMASLQATGDALTSLALAADGSELAVASLAGDVFRLPLDRQRWQADACRVVRRELSLAEWVALVPGSKPRAACSELAQRQR